MHYGTRAHKLDNPNHVVARALEPNKDWLEALINSNKGDANVKTTPVDNGDDSDAIIVSGHLGSHLEFATAHVPDENGGFDRPMERLSEGDVKFMFLGRDNFAAQSLPADSKISQMTVSLLKHAHNLHHIQMRAASYTAPDINGPAVKSFLNTLPADQAPQIIIVGLSQADLDETGEESLIDFLNENAGVKFTVFGVVERSGLTDIAVDTPLVEALRARAVFQIFDPSTVFEHYSQNATGAIYWKSSPEWAYQGHYIAAKMLSDGLVDFVKLLKSQMDEAA